MRKKLIAAFTALALTLMWPANVKAAPAIPEMSSEAYILIEAQSGTVIFEKNADKKMDTANVIKSYFMCMFLRAIDEGKVSAADKVTVSKNAAKAGGSTVFLDAGKQYLVSDLLKAVIVNSANDATIALAEHIFGGESTFISYMNEQPLSGTVVTNLLGNDTGGQCSTARDLAAICSELVEYPMFFKYSRIWLDSFVHEGGRVTEIVNLNKMIRNYEGCDGIKTGSSSSAGQCFAATASRGGIRYIYIGLNAKSSDARYNDAKSAFDYAFANYTRKNIVAHKQVLVKEMPVKMGDKNMVSLYAGETYGILSEKGTQLKTVTELHVGEFLAAPLKEGEVVGYLDIIVDGKSIKKVNVMCAQNVSLLNYNGCLVKICYDWLH